jgi:hypothetical protein
MRLTGKDIAATVSTALVVAVYIAFLQGASFPLITSVRGTAGVILALGWVGGCMLGSGSDRARDRQPRGSRRPGGSHRPAVADGHAAAPFRALDQVGSRVRSRRRS